MRTDYYSTIFSHHFAAVQRLAYAFAMRQEPQLNTTPSDGNGTGHFWWIAWTLFLTLYPLSVAPAAKLLGPRSSPPLRAIYAPLRFVYDHSQPVRSFYDWYGKAWGVHL